MRHFAIFTGWDGNPLAVRAERVIAVEDDFDFDEQGNLYDEPNGLVRISVSTSEDDDYLVQGPLLVVIQELEACLSELEDWQRN